MHSADKRKKKKAPVMRWDLDGLQLCQLDYFGGAWRVFIGKATTKKHPNFSSKLTTILGTLQQPALIDRLFFMYIEGSCHAYLLVDTQCDNH
jgi:hypothetical protein